MLELYPLKFTPILKHRIWGGNKLQELFDKKADNEIIGESWELSGIKGDESVVANGDLSGKSLVDLIKSYKSELVGKKVYEKYGDDFPLLFKLIDANDNLSIQVHPDDEIAMKRHKSFGKTEMWYVVDAEPDAFLIVGFTNDCTQDIYKNELKAGNVESLLQKVKVSKGDVFYIPAGLVHAIGKGVLVAEIQQSSDITYRIYDFDRRDNQGNERELHVEQALDVINFKASKEPKTVYTCIENTSSKLVDCKYFTTNKIELTTSIDIDYSELDSFVIYMCLTGTFNVEVGSAKLQVNSGETVMIPANVEHLRLIPTDTSTLLEVYI